MAFEVWLVPPDEAMDAGEARRAVERALEPFGAELALAENAILFQSGGQLDFYAERIPGGFFKLRALDLTIAQVVFAVADASECFLVLSAPPLLRTPANTAPTPHGFDETFEPVAISGADDLLRQMETRFGDWSDYRDHVVGKPRKPTRLGFLRTLSNRLKGS